MEISNSDSGTANGTVYFLDIPYLEEYATAINHILQTCETDKEMKEVAVNKWPRGDKRRLVFLKPGVRFTKSPDDAGGIDVHLPNEMPSSPTRLSDLRTYLAEYAKAINDILQICHTEQAMKEAAEQRWADKNDPRLLVFLKQVL